MKTSIAIMLVLLGVIIIFKEYARATAVLFIISWIVTIVSIINHAKTL